MARHYCYTFILILSLFAGSVRAENDVYFPESFRAFSKYMLAASHQSDVEKLKLFDQAIEFLAKYHDLEASPRVVSSLDEFIESEYLTLPRFGELSQEIRFFNDFSRLEKVKAIPKNDRVREEIKKYSQQQKDFLRHYLREALDRSAWSEAATNKVLPALDAIISLSVDLNRTSYLSERSHLVRLKTQKSLSDILRNLSQENKILVVSAYERVFSEVFSKVRGIGEKVAQRTGDFDIESVELDGMGRFIQLLLSSYFVFETQEGIKDMVSGFIDDPDTHGELEQFQLVLQHSLAHLIKLFQLSGRQEGIGKELAKIFRKLEKSVKPVPWVLIEEALESESENLRNQNIEILFIDKKPLATGSVAQVHRGRIKVFEDGVGYRSYDVAFRVIKPGQKVRVDQGEGIFDKIAQVIDSDPELISFSLPKLAPTIDSITMNLKRDLDAIGSGRRQNFGRKSYAFKKHVKLATGGRVVLEYYVPRVYFVSGQTGLMIQELVAGDDIDNLIESNLEASQSIIETMGHKWIDEAYFRSGFFHADMHPGNFMVDYRGKEKLPWWRRGFFSKQPYADKYQVNLLDYGMGGVADLHFRRHFFGMMWAAELGELDLLAEMIWAASDKDRNRVTLKKLKLALHENHEKQLRLPPESRLDRAFYPFWAMEQGVVFPDVFISLARGVGIQQYLTIVTKKPKRVKELMAGFLMKHPTRVVSLVKPNGLLPNEAKAATVRNIGPMLKKGASRLGSKIILKCKDILSGNKRAS